MQLDLRSRFCEIVFSDKDIFPKIRKEYAFRHSFFDDMNFILEFTIMLSTIFHTNCYLSKSKVDGALDYVIYF